MEDATDSTQDEPAEGEGNLLYTIAFDAPGRREMRQMVKMLAGSILRTGFSGDMVIFRNFPQPVFLVGRQGVGEEMVKTPGEDGELVDFARGWKAQAGEVFDA